MGGVGINKLIEIELSSIVTPYADWSKREDNVYKEEAKLALQVFYDRLTSLQPEKEYRKDYLHVSYLEYLIYIKEALNDKNYVMACNEIEKLLHFEHVLQNRVYYNLISMLERGLEV